ncbi:MAG TPA: FMN-binding protein [Clostridia bacterium]|nr:FMN-binding protein [Clostridia bacterium]HPQ46518.1 FMN-binding protein [Clostridia bacterium]HRX42122.1 FMN-binding protein [Clostridia bacterium]
MKKGYLYTIVFIAVVSIVFSGVLAAVNAAYKSRIERNVLNAEKASVLYSMGIEADDAVAVFNERVTQKDIEGIYLYSAVNDEGVMVYSIPFEGSGLWGTIRGYISVDQGLSTIKGIAFTEQNETPGLGGRIEEEWYKEQFRGIGIDKPLVYGEDSGIDAITGATSTSNAILQIMNNFIDTTLKELEEADGK